MKILILCLSEGRGGLELYIAKMVSYFEQTDIPVTICIKQATYLDDLLSNQSGKKVYLEKKFIYLPILCAVKLAKLIDQRGINYLFINWGADLPLAALAKVMSKRQPKLIYARHMKITRPKRDIYHRWVYSKVDLLLTITEQLRLEALRYLPLSEDQVKNCYLGADNPPLHPVNCQQKLQELGLANTGFHVALFGRIEHEKGQHILIEAITILKQRHILIQVAIIGHVMDTDYHKRLQQSINQNGLDEQISLVSFVDMPMAIMPCFEAVVLTTYEETFGLVLVEAMRCGVAVIGTCAGGVKEIIDDSVSGLMFEPGNSEQLANCLQSLFEDKNMRKELAYAGKIKADKMFDQDIHFKQLIRIIFE